MTKSGLLNPAGTLGLANPVRNLEHIERLSQQWHIDHLAVIHKGAFAIPLSLLKSGHQSFGPFNLVIRRTEGFLDDRNL